MATEGNEQQQDDGQGDGEQQPTVAELQAQLDALRKNNEKTTKESEKRRLELERRDAESRKLRDQGIPEPERLVRDLNEEREARSRAEERAATAERGRVDDANQRLVLIEAAKHLNDDHIDLAWDRIDRSHLAFDDDGRVVGGIGKALKALAESRPTWARAKPADPGSGRRPARTAKGDGDPIAQMFDRKTSFGT